jgi:hypothetical protein
MIRERKRNAYAPLTGSPSCASATGLQPKQGRVRHDHGTGGVNEQEGERDGQEHQDEDEEGVNLGQGRHGGQENELFISVSKMRRFLLVALAGSGYIYRLREAGQRQRLTKAATLQSCANSSVGYGVGFFKTLFQF